jgi:hypothetical protein
MLPWSLLEDRQQIPTYEDNRSEIDAICTSRVWDTLRAEIDASNLQNVILSSEEFDVLGRGSLLQIPVLFPDFEICPIIFLRNIADFIEAGFNTAVMYSNCVEDVEKYAEIQRSRIDYHQMLKDWALAANGGALTVVSYDDVYMRKDVVLTILRILGLSEEAIEPERLPPQNESASPITIELTRYLLGICAPQADVNYFKSQLLGSRVLQDNRKHFTVMPSDLRQKLDVMYLQQLELIAMEPDIASAVLGKLLLPTSTDRMLVSNVKEALAGLVSKAIDKT